MEVEHSFANYKLLAQQYYFFLPVLDFVVCSCETVAF